MDPLPFPVSPPDSAWLRMESPTNPMTITGVMGFGTELSIEALRTFVEDRLLPFDRFRMRIDGLTSSRPQWVPDEHFSLDRHVREVTLPPPGGKKGLEALVSDLMSRPLSFAKAPWEAHLVHNVETSGGEAGSALVIRLHHVIGDGIAMMHVLLNAVDEYYGPGPASAPPRTRSKPGRSRALAKTLKGAGHETIDLITSPSHLVGRLSAVGAGAKALAHLLAMRPDSRTILKGTPTASKRAAWTDPISLDRIKAVGYALDAKVNDVLMSAAAGALRRYLIEVGEPVDGVRIRAAAPFNVRPLARAHELGNSFGLVFVELPVGEPTARARLDAMKRRMDDVKRTAEPMVVYGILQTIGHAPMWAHRQVVEMFSEKASAVVTNVPGPQEPLHIMGAPIDTLMFWVPQAGDIGLGISILSLDGIVRVGIGADVAYVRDPSVLTDAFVAEFEALAQEFAPGEPAA